LSRIALSANGGKCSRERGDWVTTEVSRQQGVFEQLTTASGNQLVAAAKLLASRTIATVYL